MLMNCQQTIGRKIVCIRNNCKTYFKYNVNLHKRVRNDVVFLGLFIWICREFCPWEIHRSSPASPMKTLSIPLFFTQIT